MNSRKLRLTILDGIGDAADWSDLGRRIRAAAAEAAALRMVPSAVRRNGSIVPQRVTLEDDDRR